MASAFPISPQQSSPSGSRSWLAASEFFSVDAGIALSVKGGRKRKPRRTQMHLLRTILVQKRKRYV